MTDTCEEGETLHSAMLDSGMKREKLREEERCLERKRGEEGDVY